MLEVRNIAFALSDVPRRWHGGRKSVTTFFDTLSIFFPPGERFFVESVKAFKDLAEDDPRLREEVRAFCAQEGIHAREHVRYNAMLEVHGYPAAELERRVTRRLARLRRLLPPRRRLAITCALEHFTALMGEHVLRDDRILAGAHPTMRALWRWHAAEEAEHKAVAFDVYRLAGGPYVERVLVMLVVTAVFWTLVVCYQARMMKVDGTRWSLGEWRELFVFLFVEPGGMSRVWLRWLDYFRPSFHPSYRHDPALLERWRAEHAGDLARSA